ncbi:uncharacterized protein LOC129588866 [Paramacrobiotus metropolitanus]|uniref:uncharacterized protein LOC129588866 n=1 Tax=Paramacrobiotus metropolitanus TaxID=2943436 RepID=UPI002445EE33|nr:uncharacterized protein LOC129588866 [Paramacrobiotus metropolitanus]XP_055339245.1 uncharacterized protein LOC129588866 [Paramacrobiotus metropolitanus]
MPVTWYLFGAFLLAAFVARQLHAEDQKTATRTLEELLCLQGKFAEAATWTDVEKIQAVLQCFPLLRETFETYIRDFHQLKQLVIHMEERTNHLEERFLMVMKQGSSRATDMADHELKKPSTWNIGRILDMSNASLAAVVAIVVVLLLFRFVLWPNYNNDQQHIYIGFMMLFGMCIVGALISAWIVPGLRVQRIVKEEF